MEQGGVLKRILIVDDEESHRVLVGRMLVSAGYAFETAKNGVEAIAKASTLEHDLIILDVMMPQLDGYKTCRILKEHPDTRRIPVVMFTSLSDREARLKGLEAGADDFLGKPVDMSELLLRTKNLLKVKEYEDFLVEHNRLLEESVAIKTGELKASLIDTIYRLTLAAEHKDDDTGSHIKRTSHMVRHIARRLGFDDDTAETMFYASPMHDVGKIGIADSILFKPADLSPDEFEAMKAHTIIGGKILQGSDSPILKSAHSFAVSHHERWDGTGYPFGLKGDAIPVEGRILSVVDQYDALRSRRPYKEPFTHEKAFDIITKGNGRTFPEHFDPAVLMVFIDTHKEVEAIYEETS